MLSLTLCINYIKNFYNFQVGDLHKIAGDFLLKLLTKKALTKTAGYGIMEISPRAELRTRLRITGVI